MVFCILIKNAEKLLCQDLKSNFQHFLHIAEAIQMFENKSPQLDSEGAFLCSNTFRIAIRNELNIINLWALYRNR